MNIYSYTNYRNFLSDAITELRSKHPQLSIREILRRVGCVSPSYYKEVIVDARKNMSEKTAQSFAEFLKLAPNESLYFSALVGLNQAKTESERIMYYEKLLHINSQNAKESHILTPKEYAYLANWEISAIREMMQYVQGFGDRTDEERKKLAGNFRVKVTAEQVKNAVSVLNSLGFIEKDSNGNYRRTKKNIRSVEKVTAAYMALCQHMNLAKDIINTAPRDYRICKAVVLNMSAQAYEIVEKKINEFCGEILEIVSGDTQPEDRVYSLDLQFFPLTKLPEEKKSGNE